MESPIQQILDFIFSNIWLVIIVGGFLLNTFKRFNSGESEPTTQIPFPKQFNPFEQDKKESEETNYEAEIHAEEMATSANKNTFYERYLELQENNTYSDIDEKNETVMPVVTKPATINRTVNSTEPKVIKDFSKNKVVEGIIWSEILGPPKAKRPYQRRY